MTEETFLKIVDALVTAGVPASYEYPGWISIDYIGHGGPACFAAGDASQFFAIDVHDSAFEGPLIETIESSIHSDSDYAWREMADFVYAHWKLATLGVDQKPKQARYQTSLEQIIANWARAMRRQRGDAFATAPELKNILGDPLAWFDLLKGYDAYDVLQVTLSALR